MGLLDSIQNTLFRQSSINQKYQSREGFKTAEFSVDTPPMTTGVRSGLPVLTPPPVGALTGIGKSNPFLMSSDLSGSLKPTSMGNNKPLEQAMFIGYHNEKPIYGGGQIFMLA
jgi:hypothetical protein